jgi:AraC family transcriptional regulator of adaptative response/methylated-DNA-[protein]-cysteine methyltransferase
MPSVSITTDDGMFTATFTERGLAALDFPDAERARGRAETIPTRDDTKLREWARMTASALRALLLGKAPSQMPPLDVSRGTRFQRRVWRALQTIPLGATVSYSDVARKAGQPNATRAAGSACGANPIPVLIPCHRVLAKGNRLGGFSAGLHWKRTLLAREGVQISAG